MDFFLALILKAIETIVVAVTKDITTMFLASLLKKRKKTTPTTLQRKQKGGSKH